MLIQRSNGEIFSINLNLRIDTAIEIEYYQNGGILPYVLEEIMLIIKRISKLPLKKALALEEKQMN